MSTVLGFNGSPRAEGNTGRLVKRVLQGAEEAGATTRLYQLSEMDLRWCTACMACREKPGCVIPDEMSDVLQAIMKADAVVLGSPVYMWQVSGQTKTFMDRLYPVIDANYRTRLSQKPRMVLAFTQGHPDEAFFRPYFDQTKRVLEFLGFDVIDIVSATGTRALDDIEKQPEVLDRAAEAGRRLA